nr:serine:threonine protein kinase SIK3 [Hymenolepis microstoma]
MNPGDTPRRQLLRQEEQEEGTSAHRSDELEEESMDISKSPITATTTFTSSQRPHSMTSSNSTSTSTTNTTSSSSSAAKHCGMHIKNRQVLQIGGGGGSTTSSSTEDSEARERRFGSIDLQQPLPLKTGPCTSVTGTDLTKGQFPIDAQLKQALLADFRSHVSNADSNLPESRFRHLNLQISKGLESYQLASNPPIFRIARYIRNV